MLIKYNNSLLSVKKEHNVNLISFSFTNFMIECYDEIIRITLSGMYFYISEVCEAKLSWGSTLIFLDLSCYSPIKILDLRNHKKFHQLLLSIPYNYLSENNT